MLDNIIIVALYIAIPAAILTISFIAILRKEEKELEEDVGSEYDDQQSSSRFTPDSSEEPV